MPAVSFVAFSCAVLVAAAPEVPAEPDGQLTARVKLALLTVAGVPADAVQVDATEGTVTVYGKLPTPAQRAFAERTVREVSGVRSLRSLLQVAPVLAKPQAAQTDEEVHASAAQLLEEAPALRGSKLVVKLVQRGVLTLAGEARTLSDHVHGLRLVSAASGVRRVLSEVQAPQALGFEERITFFTAADPQRTRDSRPFVAPSSATDMRLSAAVKLRLLTTTELRSVEINVDTEDGVVTLFGAVPTVAAREDAGAQAGRVAGVELVRNRLAVVSTSQRRRVEVADAELLKELVASMLSKPALAFVEVSVRAGVVQLSGTVATGWDELDAVRRVRRMAGARAIQDQLRVDDRASAPTTRATALAP